MTDLDNTTPAVARRAADSTNPQRAPVTPRDSRETLFHQRWDEQASLTPSWGTWGDSRDGQFKKEIMADAFNSTAHQGFNFGVASTTLQEQWSFVRELANDHWADVAQGRTSITSSIHYLVLVGDGINDVRFTDPANRTVSDMEYCLTQMVKEMKAICAPDCKVLVLGLQYLDPTKQAPNQSFFYSGTRVDAFNAEVQDHATRHPDQYDFIGAPHNAQALDFDNPAYWAPDGIHPQDAYNAEQLVPLIQDWYDGLQV